MLRWEHWKLDDDGCAAELMLPRLARCSLVTPATASCGLSLPTAVALPALNTTELTPAYRHLHTLSTQPLNRKHGDRLQVLRALPPKQVSAQQPSLADMADKRSVGGALTDTLDLLITERRIEPQLAMKILANFDKAVADVLADKVKARLTFKVSSESQL